jgi:glycerate 2-kinase
MSGNMKEINEKIRDVVLRVMKIESPEVIMKNQIERIRIFISNGSYSIFSVGKASIPMVKGLEETVVKNSNLSICLTPSPQNVEGFIVFKGNHPFPGNDTFSSSEAIFNLIEKDKSEKLLFLLSGGSSSLFEKIVQGVSIDRYMEIMHVLVTGGYPIEQINSIRCILSDVKCGKMLNHSNYGEILILAISDVPGDDISVIGSNPFYPGKSLDPDKDLIAKLGIEKQNITYRECRIESDIILAGRKYASDMLDSIDLSYEKIFLGNILEGDVNICSDRLLELLRNQYKTTGKPFVFSAYGETTSRVTGNGKGGRNCYLSALILKKAEKSEEFSFVSFATDGQDGNSGLAGFLVDNTLKEIIDNDEIERYIQNSDTGNLAIKLKRDINTGPSGNNVSDVVIGYYGGKL